VPTTRPTLPTFPFSCMLSHPPLSQLPMYTHTHLSSHVPLMKYPPMHMHPSSCHRPRTREHFIDVSLLPLYLLSWSDTLSPAFPPLSCAFIHSPSNSSIHAHSLSLISTHFNSFEHQTLRMPIADTASLAMAPNLPISAWRASTPSIRALGLEAR
jgi:hypothetical protein